MKLYFDYTCIATGVDPYQAQLTIYSYFKMTSNVSMSVPTDVGEQAARNAEEAAISKEATVLRPFSFGSDAVAYPGQAALESRLRLYSS